MLSAGLRAHTLSIQRQSPTYCNATSAKASYSLTRRYASPPRRDARQAFPQKINIYRDLWPSIISALGVGIVVYYSLELWRTTLDYKWTNHDMAIEIAALKAQIEDLRSPPASNDSLSPAISQTAPANAGGSVWKRMFG